MNNKTTKRLQAWHKQATAWRKGILLIAMLAMFAAQLQAKDKTEGTVYMAGVATSFNDSTLYITTIQTVAPAYFAPKTGFLQNRGDYSAQLKSYLQGLGYEHPTCVTLYSTERKKLEKKLEKVKRRYTVKSKTHYEVKYLGDEAFSYIPVASDAGTVIVNPDEAEQAARRSAGLSQKKERRGKKKK